MKFACSLEMVNMLTSGPGAFTKQSKKFWMDYLKYIAAVGFRGIELPFNCFHSDAMAFEMGRSGIPCNADAIRTKYDSADGFLSFLKEIGIDEVTSVHINANDAMLELIAVEAEKETYYNLLEQLCLEGIEHARSLKAQGVVISPTPELGWIRRYFGDDIEDFKQKTIDILKKIMPVAGDAGLTVAFKNEFWSLFAGEEIRELLAEIPNAFYAPDFAHVKIAGGDNLCVLKEYRDHMKFVHMSDTGFEDLYHNAEHINAELPLQGSQKVFSDCGEGDIDLVAAVKTLQDQKYDGWVVCENKRTLDAYRGLLKLGWFVNQKLQQELTL